MRRRSFLSALTAATAASVLLAGCGSASSGAAASSSGSSGSAAATGKITVLAAASLTESFTTLGKQFEAAHPGTTITFSFGASSTLATQITQGAPADVFASASATNMQQVIDAKGATASAPFVKNVLQIAVPPTNPAKITGVADLAKPGVKVALCAEQVPCGILARKVFTTAKVTVTPVTIEPDVKATLTKVKLGEVDAGLVYVTDVRAAGAAVTGIPIPAELNAATSYPIAPLTATTNPALASAFVDYVRSEAGISVLTAAGFEKP